MEVIGVRFKSAGKTNFPQKRKLKSSYFFRKLFLGNRNLYFNLYFSTPRRRVNQLNRHTAWDWKFSPSLFQKAGGSRRRRAELLRSKSFNQSQGGRGAPTKLKILRGEEERRSDELLSRLRAKGVSAVRDDDGVGQKSLGKILVIS